MRSRIIAPAAVATALIATLVACTPGGGAAGGGTGGATGSQVNPVVTAADCTNEIKKADVPLVSVWAWYPNIATVVDNFNEGHDDVQVCWNNVGQGGEEYDKVQTAISAGKGLPDVVMLEADHISAYAIQNALVDLGDYGVDSIRSSFSDGAWKDVSQGDSIFGVPVDGGPMALIYRTDVFDTYGVTAPKTWDDFRSAAEKVKAAGGPLFGDLGANVPAVMMALQIQKGAEPFKVDAADPKKLTIKLNDDDSKDVLDFWAGLVKDGLVGTQDQFTTDYIAGFINGDYGTYTSAAWAPGYLTGAGVGEGASEGKFQVAPLPQWNTSSPVAVNWGGSAFSVTTQAHDYALASKVAQELYADDASLEDGWKNQVIFPLNQKVLTSDAFIDNKSEFFSGQQANKEVYVPAANDYEGFVYPPIIVYYYAQLQEVLTQVNAGTLSGSDAADQLQKTVVDYAKGQGFTVSE